MTPTTLDHALAYRRTGFSTIPVKTDGSKRPDVYEWGPYQVAPPTETEIAKWFGNGDAGIALIHGAVSGGTEVIDIDDGALLNPYVEVLDHLAPGLYLKLCVIETPRPGYHLVYKCESPQGNQKLAMRPPTDEEIEAAAAETPPRKAGPVTVIETRGEGGYTVAPGSPGACHASGREYRHIEGPALANLSMLTNEERDALLTAARALDTMPGEDAPEPSVALAGRVYEGESPGDAYARATSWAAILGPHGWVHVGDSRERQLWRRPGKQDGWSATTGNWSKQGRELLCVFSTNAHPFDGPDGSRPHSSHSKFDAYARLNHEGDYSAAAKQLVRDGFGDKPRVQYADPAMRDLDPSAPPAPPRSPVEKFTLGDLVTGFPRMKPPVIDGFLRRGETCNIIAASKVGKSWFAYGLALSVINNERWLGRFDVAPGKVLLIDNELHKETLAHRIPAVADAMGIPLDTIERDLHIWPLRGNLRSLAELGAEFDRIEPGEYQIVILDSKYRFTEPGKSENDNAEETAVYNLLDKYAEKIDSAFVLIHHSSKGSQSGKEITDVGAGAGAQSRAVDAHVVIRPHEEDNCAVMEAAVRSFAPMDPVTLRWAFPVWIADEYLDPSKLKGRLGKGAEAKLAEDAADKRLILAKLAESPEGLSVRAVRAATGFGKSKAERLLDVLTAEGAVDAQVGTASGNVCRVYFMAEGGGGTGGGTRGGTDPSPRTTGGGVYAPNGERTTHPPGRGTPSRTTPLAGPLPFAEFEVYAQ